MRMPYVTDEQRVYAFLLQAFAIMEFMNNDKLEELRGQFVQEAARDPEAQVRLQILANFVQAFKD